MDKILNFLKNKDKFYEKHMVKKKPMPPPHEMCYSGIPPPPLLCHKTDTPAENRYPTKLFGFSLCFGIQKNKVILLMFLSPSFFASSRVFLQLYGTFRRLNPLSRFFILWLGVAPNFSLFFCEFRSAAPKSLRAETRAKNTEKLGATPSQRIKSEKVDLVGGKYHRTS